MPLVRHARLGLPTAELLMYNGAMNGQHEFDVVFEPQDEGGYTAYVPDLPGCISEGDTLEEATAMIQEAMALYLDARRERGWSLPKIEHRKLVPAA
jgi:predicted RNase H-like HicB family nuclease